MIKPIKLKPKYNINEENPTSLQAISLVKYVEQNEEEQKLQNEKINELINHSLYLGSFQNLEELKQNHETANEGEYAFITQAGVGIMITPTEVTSYAPNYIRIMFTNGPIYNSAMNIEAKINNQPAYIHEKYAFGTTGTAIIINYNALNLQNSTYEIDITINYTKVYTCKLKVINGIWDQKVIEGAGASKPLLAMYVWSNVLNGFKEVGYGLYASTLALEELENNVSNKMEVINTKFNSYSTLTALANETNQRISMDNALRNDIINTQNNIGEISRQIANSEMNLSNQINQEMNRASSVEDNLASKITRLETLILDNHHQEPTLTLTSANLTYNEDNERLLFDLTNLGEIKNKKIVINFEDENLNNHFQDNNIWLLVSKVADCTFELWTNDGTIINDNWVNFAVFFIDQVNMIITNRSLYLDNKNDIHIDAYSIGRNSTVIPYIDIRTKNLQICSPSIYVDHNGEITIKEVQSFTEM